MSISKKIIPERHQSFFCSINLFNSESSTYLLIFSYIYVYTCAFTEEGVKDLVKVFVFKLRTGEA